MESNGILDMDFANFSAVCIAGRLAYLQSSVLSYLNSFCSAGLVAMSKVHLNTSGIA